MPTNKQTKPITQERFKMLKSIRDAYQQGADPSKQTGTKRVADQLLKLAHWKVLQRV